MTSPWVRHTARRRMPRKLTNAPPAVDSHLSIPTMRGDLRQNFNNCKELVKNIVADMLAQSALSEDCPDQLSIYAIGIGDICLSRNSLIQLAFAEVLKETFQNSKLYVIEPCLSASAEEFLEFLEVEKVPTGDPLTDESILDVETITKWLQYWTNLVGDSNETGSKVRRIILGCHCPPIISLGISIALIISPDTIALNNSPAAYACQRMAKNDVVRIVSRNISKYLKEIELDVRPVEIADVFANMSLQYPLALAADLDTVLESLFSAS